MMAELAEIAGFLVSEDEFTQSHIYSLIANVLFEASYFGFDEEKRKNALEDFQKSIERARMEDGIPLEEAMKKFETEFDIEFDKDSPDEKELRSAAMRAMYAYGEHCRRKQMALIADMLRGQH